MIQEAGQAPLESQHAAVNGGTAVKVAGNEAQNDENNKAESELPELLVSDKDKHEDAAEAADHVIDHQEV